MRQPRRRLAHHRIGNVEILQQRHQAARRDRQRVVLQLHHVGDGEFAPRTQHLRHAAGAEGIGPDIMQRLLVRPAARDLVFVGGIVESLFRILHMRQFLDRQEAVPFITPIARHRHQPAPVRAIGRDAHRLIADIPAAVGPDHILCRAAAIAAGFDELFPCHRLIHAQAGEIGRPAGFQPGRADRISLVMRGVLKHHRAMAGEFQFDIAGRFAFHRNRLPDHLHRFPAGLVFVLQRIGGIDVIDIDVFAVGAEDGEAPGADAVVPDGNARQRRLARADHVPARRVQMHPIAQGRRFLHPVRIIHQKRIARHGELARHDPIVAADILAPRGLIQRRGQIDLLFQARDRLGVAVFGRDLIGSDMQFGAIGVEQFQQIVRQ